MNSHTVQKNDLLKQNANPCLATLMMKNYIWAPTLLTMQLFNKNTELRFLQHHRRQTFAANTQLTPTRRQQDRANHNRDSQQGGEQNCDSSEAKFNIYSCS